MQRIEWPELGLSLSKLAFGCAPVMGRVGRRQALNAMALAFEHGVTHFDVARAYGFGEAERVLGDFIADKRDRVTVATKFGVLPARLSRAARLLKPGVRVARRWVPALSRAVATASGAMLRKGYYSPKDAQRSVEISLRELNIDAIDILFIHECSRDDDLQPDLTDLLDRLKREGKIRSWGLATRAVEIEPVMHILGRQPPVVQVRWGAELTAGAESRYIVRPITLLANLRKSDGSMSPVLREWGLNRGLDAPVLDPQLPALALQAVASSIPQAVVLCSMFRQENVLSNVAALDDINHVTARSFADAVLLALRDNHGQTHGGRP